MRKVKRSPIPTAAKPAPAMHVPIPPRPTPAMHAPTTTAHTPATPATPVKNGPAPWAIVDVSSLPARQSISPRTQVLLDKVMKLNRSQSIVVPKEYVVLRKSKWGTLRTVVGKLTIDRHLSKKGLISRTRYDRSTDTLYLFVVEKKEREDVVEDNATETTAQTSAEAEGYVEDDDDEEEEEYVDEEDKTFYAAATGRLPRRR